MPHSSSRSDAMAERRGVNGGFYIVILLFRALSALISVRRTRIWADLYFAAINDFQVIKRTGAMNGFRG